MTTRIHSFDQVALQANTLVLLDIDETVWCYETINPHWWRVTIERHRNASDGDVATATALAIHDWHRHIQATTPQHTDRDGLERLLRRIDDTHSTVLFVTARNPLYRPITEQHLKYLGLERFCPNVHYTEGASKGEYIRTHIDTAPYDRIVFIDDLASNCASVGDALQGTLRTTVPLETLQFVMEDAVDAS